MPVPFDKRIFAILFFSVFAVITGVGIVVPLLPVYADQLGASGFWTGMIFGSFSLSRTLFLPLFGRRSDIHGRKPYITMGLLLYGLSSALFMLSHDVYSLVAVRFFQGFASAMVLPVVQAYVGDISPMGKEGLVMGLFNMSMYGSLSLGPLLGGVVNDAFGLETAFFCMLVFSLVSYVLARVLLPPPEKEPRAGNQRPPLDYQMLLRHGEVTGLVFFRFAYTVCIGVVWGFLPLMAASEFHLSSSRIGVVIMMGVLVAGVMQAPMGMLSDRLNKPLMVVVGGIIMVGSMVSYVFATGFWTLAAANSVFGIGGGIAIPALMALSVIAGKRTQSMGSVMALITLGHSLGMLVGSVSAGVIRDMISLDAAYVGGGVVMLSGVVLFHVLTRRLAKTPV